MRSVAGIALRGGSVLVARRKAGGDMGGRWEFPGGGLEPGEDNAAALVREFDEEFKVPVRALEALGESSFSHNGRDYILQAVRIELLGEPVELFEHDEVLWADAETLSRLDLADSDRSLVPFILPFLKQAR